MKGVFIVGAFAMVATATGAMSTPSSGPSPNDCFRANLPLVDNSGATLTVPPHNAFRGVAARLVALARRDQAMRQGTFDDFKANLSKIEAVDRDNEVELREIFGKYGFLGVKQVGGAAVQGEFLVAQHSTNLSFHSAVLEMMVARLLKAGDVPRDYIANFIDRIQIWKREPQVYATQRDDKGVRYPSFTSDSATINLVRSAMGLVTLEQEACVEQASKR